jgi:ArsR family transcriptional regulator
MEALLTELRAAAEPTRLRLLALCARGAWCVSDLVAILGQSQPRLSRHLKLLVEAGLLVRTPEGANAWFQLAPDADLARQVLARLPEDDPLLAADRRAAARLAAERARAASDSFRRHGADWDELRALNLPAAAIEASTDAALPPRVGRLLDIGCGTGGLLERLAARIDEGVGVDASRDMLALARTRLAERGLSHIAVRQADMYRLPIADASFDAVTLQMVLHYAEDPAAALAEAARVLRPGGVLVVIDLAAHGRAELLGGAFAHRWPGFDDAGIAGWLGATGCVPARSETVALGRAEPGEADLPVRVWVAERKTRPVSAIAS